MDENKGSPWDELDIPSKGQLTVGEINNFFWGKFLGENQTKPGGWTSRDFRAGLAKEFGSEYLSIRGPAQVVKGEEPILGVTHELSVALEYIYDLPSTFFATKSQTWYAEMAKSDSDEKIQAKIKFIGGIRGMTPDHIVISRGLASKLGIAENVEGDIKILGISADIDKLDLDNWG